MDLESLTVSVTVCVFQFKTCEMFQLCWSHTSVPYVQDKSTVCYSTNLSLDLKQQIYQVKLNLKHFLKAFRKYVPPSCMCCRFLYICNPNTSDHIIFLMIISFKKRTKNFQNLNVKTD